MCGCEDLQLLPSTIVEIARFVVLERCEKCPQDISRIPDGRADLWLVAITDPKTEFERQMPYTAQKESILTNLINRWYSSSSSASALINEVLSRVYPLDSRSGATILQSVGLWRELDALSPRSSQRRKTSMGWIRVWG